MAMFECEGLKVWVWVVWRVCGGLSNGWREKGEERWAGTLL